MLQGILLKVVTVVTYHSKIHVLFPFKLPFKSPTTKYTVFRDFPQAELKLVPILRAMRQIHFAAWCAIQKADPHFQHHFPDWGSIRYWNELVKYELPVRNI